jgi:hypothetical protein
MSDPPPDNPPEKKTNGCRWILITLGVLIGLFVVALLFAAYFISLPRGPKLQPRAVIKDLQVAISSYQVDYNRFPIPESDASRLDISIRSRGPILPALMGKESTALNPRNIKFIDLPKAQDRKFGLWQDGSEWVLSDLWGEPYYIVFDTNKDGKIANPEYGADQSDAQYAKLCRVNPPPATLPLSVLVYSSGSDRDPKTWHDNICNWRSR